MRCLILCFLVTLSSVRGASAAALESSSSANGTAVIREMNLARQRPDVYAGYIAELRGRFYGNNLVLPDRTTLRTHEGVAAVDDAIRFLRRSRP